MPVQRTFNVSIGADDQPVITPADHADPSSTTPDQTKKVPPAPKLPPPKPPSTKVPPVQLLPVDLNGEVTTNAAVSSPQTHHDEQTGGHQQPTSGLSDDDYRQLLQLAGGPDGLKWLKDQYERQSPAERAAAIEAGTRYTQDVWKRKQEKTVSTARSDAVVSSSRSGGGGRGPQAGKNCSKEEGGALREEPGTAARNYVAVYVAAERERVRASVPVKLEIPEWKKDKDGLKNASSMIAAAPGPALAELQTLSERATALPKHELVVALPDLAGLDSATAPASRTKAKKLATHLLVEHLQPLVKGLKSLECYFSLRNLNVKNAVEAGRIDSAVVLHDIKRLKALAAVHWAGFRCYQACCTPVSNKKTWNQAEAQIKLAIGALVEAGTYCELLLRLGLVDRGMGGDQHQVDNELAQKVKDYAGFVQIRGIVREDEGLLVDDEAEL